MAGDSRQLTCHGSIDVFYYGEVGWEQDVEVALLNQRRADGDSAPLISRLNDGSIHPLNRVWQGVEVTR